MRADAVRVIAVWVAPPGAVDDVRGVLERLSGRTGDERGCLGFEVWEAVDDPGRFVLVEDYAGEDARQAAVTTRKGTDVFVDDLVSGDAPHRGIRPVRQPHGNGGLVGSWH